MKLAIRIFNTAILVAVIAAVLAVLTHATAIQDWFRLRNYHPPAAVQAFTVQDTMTPYATHLFYINHPEIQSNVATFRSKCTVAEQTIVLGCYLGNEDGIEIYDVSDSRLNGVEQVTAAHEMLHAAYDRLSTKDKNSVDAMLQDYYQHDLTDPRIKDTINSYKQTEPNDVVNEMHSVFGTEVANLPPPLEQYYSRYFTDRAKVAAYAASYEGEFTSRKSQIEAYDQQLSILKSQIQNEESDLQSQLVSLQTDRARIQNSGNQSDVDSYNASVSAYNAGVRKLQSDISYYNGIVSQRNSIAAELESLQSSLDTRLSTQPAQ